jgi:starch phosphorylase
MSAPLPDRRQATGSFPADMDGFDSLAELALNMRCSWNHATDEIWRRLDPALWEFTQNPWVVLQTVSRDKLESVLLDPAFRKKIDELVQTRRRGAEAPAWFQRNHSQSPLTCIAYFSMEFMLSEALPIYSGGLGNVAGDQLKAASDLGAPVAGIGLLYQQGYFRQMLDENGAQLAFYPYNDPGQLPVAPLRRSNGEWLRLEIALPGYSVWLRVWQVQVGRVKLYLLDSNDASNYPVHRGITSQLYGGGPELRLQQEMVLGLGGWRLIEALELRPEICHLNEGHAAFAVLERAYSFMKETGQPFQAALAVTRAGNLFTTHTAVAAGFDRFPPALIGQYFGRYAREKLDISLRDFLALGRQNPGDDSEPFNMAYLAVRGSGSVNGVSRLHGRVSRRLFAPLFARWAEDEVPISHVTNGVHMPTWDSAAADDLWTQSCGKDRWVETSQSMPDKMRGVSDIRLWEMRAAARKVLVDYVRERFPRQLAISRAPPETVEAAKHLFDPNTLTLGFARRFATYKRPNLILRDPARLFRLLANPRQPVQLIMAGKAHPADQAGMALIQEWIRFIQGTGALAHAIFLSDYDMFLAERLVRGVDVWINTPRRPWEASGTSGMKVLVNGGLNLSELDGWWAEAYAPEVGWALGDGLEHGDDAGRDAAEAEELYDRLENEVIPEFYARAEDGLPTAWIARMRESMARLAPQFCASRTVREYTDQHYWPAAAKYLERAADKGAFGRRMVEWRGALDRQWAGVRFGAMKVETRGDQRVFEVEVNLGELDPGAVQVELFANGTNGGAVVRQEMKRLRDLEGVPGGGVYSAAAPASRPESEFTARVIPRFDGAVVPLEAAQICWQR